MHDINCSAAIAVLVYLFTGPFGYLISGVISGTPGPNRFGPDPAGEAY